ncbi:hypothetical protein RRG08_034054 [Elysia crispata]|uniref:Uncharacterized protein n=1 Tax=Elysia crispata TaxID=231223 RepID=A0AAE0YLL7_9GAST|nr:hypothetical protein RRG08_034054 [Elysia crispata]
MKVTSGWSNNCKDMLEVDSGQHGAKSITIACNSYLYQYAGFVKSSKDLRAYRVTRGWILDQVRPVVGTHKEQTSFEVGAELSSRRFPFPVVTSEEMVNVNNLHSCSSAVFAQPPGKVVSVYRSVRQDMFVSPVLTNVLSRGMTGDESQLCGQVKSGQVIGSRRLLFHAIKLKMASASVAFFSHLVHDDSKCQQ